MERHALPGEALMSFAIRTLVVLAILVPYWLVRQPREFSECFVIALIAVSFGYLVAALATPPSSDGKQ
jgi:hypothetical protein